jgi:hypothetical protein
VEKGWTGQPEKNSERSEIQLGHSGCCEVAFFIGAARKKRGDGKPNLTGST